MLLSTTACTMCIVIPPLVLQRCQLAMETYTKCLSIQDMMKIFSVLARLVHLYVPVLLNIRTFPHLGTKKYICYLTLTVLSSNLLRHSLLQVRYHTSGAPLCPWIEAFCRTIRTAFLYIPIYVHNMYHTTTTDLDAWVIQSCSANIFSGKPNYGNTTVCTLLMKGKIQIKI